MPETSPRTRTPAQLREAAWQTFSTARKPLTPKVLALEAGITDGAAHRFLTDWHANGRAVPLAVTPPTGPHETPWALAVATPNASRATANTTPTPQRPGTTFRVLVTGSRTWTHKPTITTTLDRLHTEHDSRLMVVHGACPGGADAIADRWARDRGVPVETHPADWTTGRVAGPHRNAAVVATGPALCLAFIRDDSPGATGCARLAEAAGIPTTRHTHPAPTPTAPRRGPRPAPDVVLAAALDYAARGRAVFMLGRTKRPVANCPACRDATDDHDPQVCDCLTCHGFYAASTDPDRVRAIVAAVPGGLLAVRTGAVVDASSRT